MRFLRYKVCFVLFFVVTAFVKFDGITRGSTPRLRYPRCMRCRRVLPPPMSCFSRVAFLAEPPNMLTWYPQHPVRRHTTPFTTYLPATFRHFFYLTTATMVRR